MSDNVHMRDAAGNVSGYADLSIYDPGQINMIVCSPDGRAGILFDCDLSATAARRLAIALLQAADDCEGGAQ